MKHIACFALIMLLLAGCNNQVAYTPVDFYYPRQQYQYAETDGVIAIETRTDIPYQSASFMLSAYLEGPEDITLNNPFPKGLRIVSVYTQGGTAYVTLSEEFAQLTGVQLTIACACLGNTVMSFMNTDTAVIHCESLLLDGKRNIQIDKNNVFFYDDIPQEDFLEEEKNTEKE